MRHTLIDCGMGVVPSLLELEQSHRVHVFHKVPLTNLLLLETSILTAFQRFDFRDGSLGVFWLRNQ